MKSNEIIDLISLLSAKNSLEPGKLIVLTRMLIKSSCVDSCHRSLKLESGCNSRMFMADKFGSRFQISEVINMINNGQYWKLIKFFVFNYRGDGPRRACGGNMSKNTTEILNLSKTALKHF